MLGGGHLLSQILSFKDYGCVVINFCMFFGCKDFNIQSRLVGPNAILFLKHFIISFFKNIDGFF